MGSVTDMIDVFINAVTGFIDTGSTAADGFGDVFKGALGSITE